MVGRSMAGRTSLTLSGWGARRMILSSRTKEHHGQLTSTGGELGVREWAAGIWMQCSWSHPTLHCSSCCAWPQWADRWQAEPQHHPGRSKLGQKLQRDYLEQQNQRASPTANFYWGRVWSERVGGRDLKAMFLVTSGAALFILLHATAVGDRWQAEPAQCCPGKEQDWAVEQKSIMDG